jgi:hypothetical protein
VSGEALLGLVGFVAIFTAAGFGVLAAVQGHRPARALAWDAGLAYALGVAALGSLLTVAVVVGVPLTLVTIVVAAAVLLVGGTVVGRRRSVAVASPLGAAGRFEHLITAVLIGVTIVVLEVVFRAARLEGLFGWDAGSFWVPKAEAIYFTGGIDEWHFSTLGGPSYPPFIPVLQATAFHLFGGVDVVALHLVYWSILAGFVAAAVRLLTPIARPSLAWAGVLLVIVADQLAGEAANPQADVLMDLLLGLGVLYLVSWLLRREPGLFAGAVVFLSAAALVKREALLLVGCIGVALAVTEARRLRTSWPYALAVVVVPVAVTIPWRVWFTRRSLPGDGPEAGPLALLEQLDRVLPSARLVLETIADPGLWSLIFAVALLSIAAALASGERRVAPFALVFATLACAGFAWVMWSFPSLPLTKTGALNPIPRLVGAALVPLGLLVPVLLTSVLGRSRPRIDTAAPRPGAALLIVVAVALGYPAAVLALDGTPRFPSTDECAVLADPPADGDFLAVYERTASLPRALEDRDRLAAMGFVGAEVLPDGCGRWKVANPDVVTVDQARGHADDAARAGFELRLEER